MPNTTNNVPRQNRDLKASDNGRPPTHERGKTDRIRDAFHTIRREPSSASDRQQINLDNDLYERQSI
jgi:hypothetical protein